MKPSSAYQTFLASMTMTYEKCREGESYDLDALDDIRPAERSTAIAMLTAHLAASGVNWRDVEALTALGAFEPVRAALSHPDYEIRLHAARQLEDQGEAVDWDAVLIPALSSGFLDAAFSKALDLAEDHPSPNVIKALLACAGQGRTGEARVNAAAMTLYLAGKAEEPFDWDHRPFFLRFGEDDPREVREAYQELCDRIGMAA